jgi:hypothetical protein
MSGTAVERFHGRIVDEHIDELRFLLHLRAHRLPFARGDVHEWLAFDRRLMAHVDGLLLRAATAWARLEPMVRTRPRTQNLQLSGVLALNLDDEAIIDRWFALAATSPAGVRAAEELTHWLLPERVAPLMSLLVDDGLSGELPLAVALELAQRMPSSPQDWAVLAERTLALASPSPVLARAVSRVAAGEAAAAWAEMAQAHPHVHLRWAAACAGCAVGDDLPTLREAAWLGPEATMRTALRLPADALPAQLRELVDAGERLASACAVTARGQARWAELVAPAPGEEDPDKEEAHALLYETLTGKAPGADAVTPPAGDTALLSGHPRTIARCLRALRHGECVTRLVCAQVLQVEGGGFAAPDVLAPMWQQLRHPALSTAASTEPAPAR